MMYAETFLEQFASFVCGPDGVHRLRELVLRLGLGGRLGTDMDTLFNWRMFQINDIADCFMGNSISAAEKSERYEGLKEGLPYIATKDVDGWHGGINYESGVKIPYDQSRMKVAPAGSVLICAEGGSAGRKIGVLEKDVNFGNKLICCVPNSEIILQKYLFRLFQSPSFQEDFKKEMTGIIGGITISKFKSLQVRVPELNLQHEIVNKVDELMALCDKLEVGQTKGTELKHEGAVSALHHLTEAKTPEETADRWSLIASSFGGLFDDHESIRELRGAALVLAISGLFGSVRNPDVILDEPTNRVIDTRTNNSIEMGTGDTSHERPFPIPQHWKWKKLSDLTNPSKPISYGVIKLGNETKGGVPILRCSDVKYRKINLNSVKKIDSEIEQQYLRTRLLGGEILVNVRGTLGGCAIVPRTIAGYNVAREVAVVDPNSAITPDFLLAVFSSPYFQNRVNANLKGIAYKGLNLGILSDFPIPLPPVVEQRRIVAKVDELMLLCDQLEDQVREGEQLNVELMASLIRALTETDRDGGGAVEPASFAEEPAVFLTAESRSGKLSVAPQRKSPHTANVVEAESGAVSDGMHSLNTKFQEAVLIGAIVRAFFEAGGYPIGNFRLQKAVYFACRRMGGHLGEMAYLKKAAGPYNPSMKYSDGIAMAKQRNWLRVARGRFGFGHVPGFEADEMDGWIAMYGYGEPVRWVAEHFRFKRNDEWETLATVDYVVEHLQSLGIRPAAAQILQYIRADDAWYPKIEKLGLTEMSVTASVVELEALFGTTDEEDSA